MMFIPSLLAEKRSDVLWDLMTQNALGALIVSDGLDIDANHLPFEIDREGETLRTHVSRANPLWNEARRGAPALVIFQGPNHYISPTWQPGRVKHGRVAPSWNYAVAHAYGVISFKEDEQWLKRHLAGLAAREEAMRPEPWSLDAAPADFIGGLLPRIVGIEIKVTRLLGKSQACQQYNEATRAGVIAGLEAEGTERAAEMAQIIRAASDMG